MLTRRAIALYAVAALLLAGSAQAKPGKGPKQGNAEGSITNIVAATATTPERITISGKTAVTLNVTSGTRIQVGDANGTTADLHIGDQVHAQYDPSTFNASRITLQAEDDEGQDVHATGVVLSTSTDATTGLTTLTLDLNGDGVADLTLVVNSNTKIELDDGHLTLSQLGSLVGLRVKVEYDSKSFVAKEIEVDEGGALQATGTVTAIDATNHTLTIQTASGPLTFQITDATSLRMGGTTLTLADVQVGDTVTVRYLKSSTGQNVALSAEVRVPKVNFDGVLTAVGTNSITVKLKNGTSVTMTVDASTDLRINGKVATLAQLQTALTTATNAHLNIKVSGQYLVRGSTNLATQLRVNVKGRGF